MKTSDWSRREFVAQGTAALTTLLAAKNLTAENLLSTGGKNSGNKPEEKLPPHRTITRGPRHHWFGYYDKLQFDPTSRYALGMSVGFEHRSPKPDDAIEIGMVDLEDQDRWISLGSSTAWCWQQGCMLQWIPGSSDTVLWNDRERDQYVCRILNVKTKSLRTIPHPVYALSPNGRTAIATDFRRLGHCRPGYGYNGIADPAAHIPAPDDSGIWHVDLETGEQKLLVSIAQVADLDPQLPSMKGTAKHWFNHLLFNPDGSRFVFLHRWEVGSGRETRMLTASTDGSDLRVIDANGLTSHFIWRDPQHLLAFSNQPSDGKRFYLFEDKPQGEIIVVGKDQMTQDGHCTFLPGNKWILNDSYPDRARLQHPYLFEVQTARIVPLGNFLSPAEYTGEWRCDTHPRFSPDGRKVIIDSPHAAEGRQLHLIDLSDILA